MTAQRQPLPLSCLLSQTLVAFTVEVDNEFEHEMPHRITRQDRTGRIPRERPWLTSLAMWTSCLQHIPAEGITVTELGRRARTHTNLDGMRRWSYITIDPDTTNLRSKTPRPTAVLRPTAPARVVQELFRELLVKIEQRWRERFGAERVHDLRGALVELVVRIGLELPYFMPILGYGLATSRPGQAWPAASEAEKERQSGQPLPTLLARVLLAFAMEFEAESELSLAMSADLVRVIFAAGTPVKELPRLSGVSKEAIAMGLGHLCRQGYAAVGGGAEGLSEAAGAGDRAAHNPSAARAGGSRTKIALLTEKGGRAQETYFRLTAEIEAGWRKLYGAEPVDRLRSLLEPLVGSGELSTSPLATCLKPYPDGWRSGVRPPTTLPHFPMVLHRGGYPDGS